MYLESSSQNQEEALNQAEENAVLLDEETKLENEQSEKISSLLSHENLL